MTQKYELFMLTIKKELHHSNAIRLRVILAIKRIISSHHDVRSRSALARRLNTFPSIINKWENLEGYPTVENLADLCTEFNIDANWLVLGIGKMLGDAEIVYRIDELEKRMSTAELRIGIKRKP